MRVRKFSHTNIINELKFMIFLYSCLFSHLTVSSVIERPWILGGVSIYLLTGIDVALAVSASESASRHREVTVLVWV